ncbi:MAG: TRIC cation channel family protein [Thermomicrobiales bacterium]
MDLDLGGPFKLPLWFDYSATFVWALSGALIAARRRYDIAGIAALALVSATGGGLLRDGIFLQIGPPLFLRSWVYMALVVVASLAVNLAGSRIQRIPLFDRTIALVDALGLGGFAITGLQLSLLSGLSPPAAVFVGVVNAVGGGVLRDLLVRREVTVFVPGPPAALAALAGCLIYLAITLGGLGGALAGTISVVAVFVIRVTAIRYGWQTKAPAGFEPLDPRET